jgi:hypothetical protein
MIPGETIASGASSTCSECSKKVELEVLRSGAGFYIGTQCECGPYSRESGYYGTREAAAAALQSGNFGR